MNSMLGIVLGPGLPQGPQGQASSFLQLGIRPPGGVSEIRNPARPAGAASCVRGSSGVLGFLLCHLIKASNFTAGRGSYVPIFQMDRLRPR